MVMRPVVRLDAIAATPWKNGGGSTRTLAVSPEGASLDDFVWRVSLAEVASSGPFSEFAGIDRTIALWSGNGMLLESPGRDTHRLERELEPYEFPGEIAVQATLIDGPTTDFNLMIRRGVVAASVMRVDGEMILPRAEDLLLVCCSGSFTVDAVALCAGETVHASGVEDGLHIVPNVAGSVLLCAVVVGV